jgi:hypothetical protein
MARPSYGDRRRAPVPASQARQARKTRSATPPEMLHAAQAVAGNAAVTRALEAMPPDQRNHRSAASGDQPDTAPITLRPPDVELDIVPHAFHRLLADKRVRSEHGIAAMLAKKRGVTLTHWNAATGARATAQPAAFESRRRMTTIRGQIDDFRGIGWEHSTLPDAPRRAIDLYRVAAGEGSMTGKLRVRMGNTYLIHEPTPVHASLDGLGSVRLKFTLDDATLTMVGTAPRTGVGEMLWEYTLVLRNRQLATGIWATLPRNVRLGTARISGDAGADDSPEPPARDRDRPTDTLPTPSPPARNASARNASGPTAPAPRAPAARRSDEDQP